MTEDFNSKYQVTIGDINYGGHLGNDRALVIFQDARILFLNSLGFSEMDIGEGLGIIMVECGVRYLREIFHGDQLITTVSVVEMKPKKFTLGYRTMRVSDNQTVLSGSSTFLAFNYSERKVVKLPEVFKIKLEPHRDDNLG